MRNMEEFCYPIFEWEYDNKALKESMDKMPASFEMWTPFARELKSKADLYPSEQKKHEDPMMKMLGMIDGKPIFPGLEGYYEMKCPEFLDDPYIKSLRDKINLPIEPHNCAFVKIPAGFNLRPHKDINRKCAIHFPFNFDDAPTLFFNDRKDTQWTYAHVHSCPAVLNILEVHGVDNTGQPDRFCLQFSLYEPYDKVVSMIKDKTFWTN